MVLKQGRGTSFSRNLNASWVALALLLAGCNPAGQPKDSSNSSGESTAAPVKESGSFGLSSLMAAFNRLIGNPGSSTQRRDDQSGRVCTIDNYQQSDAQVFAKADILFVQDTS